MFNDTLEAALHAFANSTSVQCVSPALNTSLEHNRNVNDEIAELWIQESTTCRTTYTGAFLRFLVPPRRLPRCRPTSSRMCTSATMA